MGAALVISPGYCRDRLVVGLFMVLYLAWSRLHVRNGDDRVVEVQ